MSGEAKVAFGEATLPSGEASQQSLVLRSYGPLDYLLVMRDINRYNRPLKEAFYPTKLVQCKPIVLLKRFEKVNRLQRCLFSEAKLVAS